MILPMILQAVDHSYKGESTGNPDGLSREMDTKVPAAGGHQVCEELGANLEIVPVPERMQLEAAAPERSLPEESAGDQAGNDVVSAAPACDAPQAGGNCGVESDQIANDDPSEESESEADSEDDEEGEEDEDEDADDAPQEEGENEYERLVGFPPPKIEIAAFFAFIP